jgi:hypothetical protein
MRFICIFFTLGSVFSRWERVICSCAYIFTLTSVFSFWDRVICVLGVCFTLAWVFSGWERVICVLRVCFTRGSVSSCAPPPSAARRGNGPASDSGGRAFQVEVPPNAGLQRRRWQVCRSRRV